MTEKGKVEVRSADRRNFTMIPNYIVRGGNSSQEIAVLVTVASFAFGSDGCFASMDTICGMAGVSRNTAAKAIRKWRDAGVISVKQQKGGTNVITTIFDFTVDMLPTPPPNERGGTKSTPPKREGTPPPNEKGVPPPNESYEEDKLNKTTLNNTSCGESAAGKAEPVDKSAANIVAVIDAFRDSGLWPIPNYGNRTERKAAETLAAKFGAERVVGMVGRYAQELAGDEFMPKAHKPSLFVEKLGMIAARMKSPKKGQVTYV